MTSAGHNKVARWRWFVAAATVGILLLPVYWPQPIFLPPLPPHADPAVAEAYAAARQQVRHAPHSAEAWGRLGMTLLANDDIAAAVPFLAEAERLDPDDRRWPYLQAMILLHGQPEAALMKARRAQELAPHYANIHVVAGEIAFLQGQASEAAAAFQQALRADPDNVYALLGVARCHADERRLDECRQVLGRILAHGAVAKAAQTLLAEVLDRLGQSDAARDAGRRAQRLPDDPPRGDRVMDEVEACLAGYKALKKRTERLQKQGALDAAIDNQQQAVDAYPQQVAACLLLGKLYAQRARTQTRPQLRHDDLTSAQSTLQSALQLAPDDMRIKFYLGLAFFEQRSIGAARAQAIAHFRGVLARQPGDSLAAEHLADCLMLDGDWSGAAAAYRKLVELRPDLAEAHAALAEALERQHDWTAALVSWLNARHLEPDRSEYQIRIALILRRLLL